MVAEQPALSFAGLLRQLRAEAKLTQEELAAARGNVPAAQVLAAVDGAGSRPGAMSGSPYRGLSVFGEQDAGWFFGREAAASALLDRMSRLVAGVGLLVVSGASGA